MEKNETFRRAHGAKQKQERIRQIVDAAAEIYDKDGYDAVTFSSVGRKVNFNRANIYHYFPNIEDIFLLILRRDIETMVCDAEQSFKDFRGGADSFAAAWAALMLRHQRMLSLFCVANTLLLRNATPKAHLEFREDIFIKYNRLNVIIKNIFPSMSDESEAGWKDTNGDGIVDKDGKNLEVDFVYYSSRAELPIFAEATQADAAKIGIKVNLKNVDYNVMDKLGVSGDYDLMISNIMTEQAGDPLNFLNMYWRSNIDGQNPQNSSGYSNPTYDALGDALRVEFDKSKRRDIIISMQKIIMDDAAAIIFGYPQTNIISNKSITGAKIQACDYYWLTKDWKPAN